MYSEKRVPKSRSVEETAVTSKVAEDKMQKYFAAKELEKQKVAGKDGK